MLCSKFWNRLCNYIIHPASKAALKLLSVKVVFIWRIIYLIPQCLFIISQFWFCFVMSCLTSFFSHFNRSISWRRKSKMKQLGRDYIIAINDVDPQKVISIKHSPPITEDLRQNILREVQLCSCQIKSLGISIVK